MNKGQLGAIGAELEPFFAVDAKKRKKEAIKERDDKGRAKPVEEKIPQLVTVPKRQPQASELSKSLEAILPQVIVVPKREPQASELAKKVGAILPQPIAVPKRELKATEVAAKQSEEKIPQIIPVLKRQPKASDSPGQLYWR